MAYAPSGAGFVILLVEAVLVLALVAWVVYWTGHGFRAGPFWKPWLLMVTSLLALMLCFPPMRRTGEWIDEATALPIPSSAQSVFDRHWYGYIPSYRRLGEWGTEVEELSRYTVKIGGRGPYAVSKAHWVIDWWYLGGQLIALALLLLPFLRAQAGHEDAEPLDDAERATTA